MPITRTLEVITTAPLDVATAEATGTVDRHCIVERYSAQTVGEHSVVVLTAIFGNEAEVPRKAEEIRQALGKYGTTDVVER